MSQKYSDAYVEELKTMITTLHDEVFYAKIQGGDSVWDYWCEINSVIHNYACLIEEERR